MLEEYAFDHVLRAYVREELLEEAFTNDEQQCILEIFSRETFKKQNRAPVWKIVDNWISMLKRLMVHILNANVSLDVPIQFYLERTDLWNDRVTDADLTAFQVHDDILLQHTYMTLCGLERQYQMRNKHQSK
ncbi:unnamed protein product [Rotaria sp. Silwood2]|nr:unnamed protein product [Rotaria sp. Silwood2]CAF4197624.1 unnamed protein product [Rotaria sp. Silwood2]